MLRCEDSWRPPSSSLVNIIVVIIVLPRSRACEDSSAAATHARPSLLPYVLNVVQSRCPSGSRRRPLSAPPTHVDFSPYDRGGLAHTRSHTLASRPPAPYDAARLRRRDGAVFRSVTRPCPNLHTPKRYYVAELLQSEDNRSHVRRNRSRSRRLARSEWVHPYMIIIDESVINGPRSRSRNYEKLFGKNFKSKCFFFFLFFYFIYIDGSMVRPMPTRCRRARRSREVAFHIRSSVVIDRHWFMSLIFISVARACRTRSIECAKYIKQITATGRGGRHI